MKISQQFIKLTIKIAISQSGITPPLRSFLRLQRLLRSRWGDPPATASLYHNGGSAQSAHLATAPRSHWTIAGGAWLKEESSRWGSTSRMWGGKACGPGQSATQR